MKKDKFVSKYEWLRLYKRERDRMWDSRRLKDEFGENAWNGFKELEE